MTGRSLIEWMIVVGGLLYMPVLAIVFFNLFDAPGCKTVMSDVFIRFRYGCENGAVGFIRNIPADLLAMARTFEGVVAILGVLLVSATIAQSIHEKR